MPAVRSLVLLAVASLLAALGLSACTTRQLDDGLTTVRGGTLHVLTGQRVTTWDPQRMASAPEGAFAARTFIRTLTTQAPSGAGFSTGLIADLASTTGYSSDGGRTWGFSVVSNARWQDDRFVSCEDIRYGVSRAFDPQVLASGSAGARYAVRLLDIPTLPGGGSAYAGPYVGTGQALFDAAVSCQDHQLTFRLKTPRQDFGEIVSMPAFAPYRKDVDPRLHPQMLLDPTFAVFSAGPYMLEGAWVPGQGGRFVRNRKWTAYSDPVRQAWPDVVEVDEATSSTVAIQRIIDDGADDGRVSVTWASAPQGMLEQLAQDPLSARATYPDSLQVDTLLTNPGSRTLAAPAVRRAFAQATPRTPYADAFGHSPDTQAVVPVASLIARNLPGHPQTAPTGSQLTGDPAAARAALLAAGATLPVSLTLAVPADAPDTARAGLRAMLPTWARAGFAVRLEESTRPSASLSTMSGLAATSADLAWAAVTAQVPTAGAALESVYDAPQPAAVRSAVVAAAATSPSAAQVNAWAAVDERAGADGWQVPLGQHRHAFVHGSGVEAYEEALLMGGYVDLAMTQVDHSDQ